MSYKYVFNFFNNSLSVPKCKFRINCSREKIIAIIKHLERLFKLINTIIKNTDNIYMGSDVAQKLYVCFSTHAFT